MSAILLELLLEGPQMILHIPEDAAAELERRTGGALEMVEAELRCWLRGGLSWPPGRRLRLSRDALDRLIAGAGRDVDLPQIALEGDAALALAMVGLGWHSMTLASLQAALRWETTRFDAAP